MKFMFFLEDTYVIALFESCRSIGNLLLIINLLLIHNGKETGQTKAHFHLVSSPLDDLCIDVWISVMIIYLRTQMTKR